MVKFQIIFLHYLIGVKQSCVLAPTLFNFYLNTVMRLALTDYQLDAGLCFLDANFVGTGRSLHQRCQIHLDYDDMALIFDSYETILPCWNL